MAVATFEKIWRKKKGPTFADLPGFEDIWNNKSAVLVEPEPALVSTEFAPSSISGAPLTAGEIAEDKADEQRNIQMAFIREHPELIQQTQRKEEDQLIDDFFSKLPEPKTDYDKRLRLSNMRLALEGEPKSYHRKVYLARAKRAKIKEMQEQGLILDERQQYKGFWNELGRNTAGGGLNVASGLLGTLASVSEGAIWDKDKIEEWAQKLHKLSSKPAYTAAKEGGWKGFVAASIGQALPYMGAALASVLVTGQPYAAFGVGFSVEGDNAYRDALAAGATEEEAQMNRLIVGTINGAIEQIQVGQIFKFARAGRGSMRAISKAAQDRAMKKIAKIGGKLTLDSLYHAARESLEEVLQETTSIAAESRVNPEVWNNAIERIVQSGLGGGVVGLAFGTAGAVRTHVAHPIETVIKPAMYALGLDKKSREFKEFALTREGSEIVAAMSPELATRLAAKEQPSRADLKELGVSGWNAKERAQLSSFFRDALEDQERMASNQRAIEQLEEAVAWQQREAETAPTVPIAEPTEAVAARKPAEAAEIPPIAAEVKPEPTGLDIEAMDQDELDMAAEVTEGDPDQAEFHEKLLAEQTRRKLTAGEIVVTGAKKKQEPVAKPAAKPAEKVTPGKRFYWYDFEKKKFVETKGTLVKFEQFPELDLFVQKEGKNWIVSEGRTGGRITNPEKTKKKALDMALDMLMRNKDKIEETLQAAIEKSGLFPRYTEAAPAAEKPKKKGLREKPVKESEQLAKLMNNVHAYLQSEAKAIDNRIVDKMAREVFGAAAGHARDAYDAFEAGMNKYIETNIRINIDEGFESLQQLEQQMPRQTRRDDAQVEFQQFSTPPTEAYVVVRAAAIVEGMLVLEPSASTGNIAVLAREFGGDVEANEIDERRRGLLEALGFKTLNINAEQLDNLLDPSKMYDVVVMNPPFSATGGRVEAHSTKVGARHVEQALLRLKKGGRLVAIVGEGMALDRVNFRDWWAKIEKKYDVRANIGMSGKYYGKFGTTFGNQIVIIDNTGATESEGQIVTGTDLSPTEALTLLDSISRENVYERIKRAGEKGDRGLGRAAGPEPGPAPATGGAAAGRGRRAEPTAPGGVVGPGVGEIPAARERGKGIKPVSKKRAPGAPGKPGAKKGVGREPGGVGSRGVPGLSQQEQQALDESLKKLQKKLSEEEGVSYGVYPEPVKKGRKRAALNPEILMLGIKSGSLFAKSGITSYVDWSKRMVDAVGVRITPYLKRIYQSIRNKYPQYNLQSDEAIKAAEPSVSYGKVTEREAEEPSEPVSYVYEAAETKAGEKLLGKLRKDARRSGRKKVGLRSIVNYLNDQLRVLMLVGKTQLKKKYPARFETGPHIIRTKSGVWQLNFHEAGHALSAMIDAEHPGWFAHISKMLLEMTGPGTMASAKNPEEGLAELCRLYVIDPGKIPDQIKQQFEKLLNEIRPDLLAAFRDTHRAYTYHTNRPLMDQAQSLQYDMPQEGSSEQVVNMFWDLMQATIGDSMITHRVMRRIFNQIAEKSWYEKIPSAGIIGSIRSLLSKSYRTRLKLARDFKKDIQNTPADYDAARQSLQRVPQEVEAAMSGIKTGPEGISVLATGIGFNAFTGPMLQTLRDAGFTLPESLDPGHGNRIYIHTKSFSTIKHDVGLEVWDEFCAYGQFRAALNRWKTKRLRYPGMRSGLGPDKVTSFLAEQERLHPDWKEHFNSVNEYMDQLLLVPMLSGEKTVTEVIRIKKAWTDYWPLPRQIEGRPLAPGTGADYSSGIRSAYGSSLPFRSLDEAVRMRTRMAFEAYYTHRFMLAMVNLGKAVGKIKGISFEAKKMMNRIMLPLRLDIKKIGQLTEHEEQLVIADFLNKQAADLAGVTVKELKASGQAFKVEDIVVTRNHVDLWRKKKPNAIHVVSLFENGDRKYYQITDRQIFNMFARGADVGKFVRHMSNIFRPMLLPWKRAKTQNWGFVLWNPFRDSSTAMVLGNEKESYIRGYYLVAAMINRLTKRSTEAMLPTEMLSKTLDQLTQDSHRNIVESFFGMLIEGISVHGWTNMSWLERIESVPGQIISVGLKPVDIANWTLGSRYFSQLFEELTREGAYNAARKRGGSQERAQQAYETVSGNFGQRGSNAQVASLIRIAGFLNPGIQILGGQFQAATDPDPSSRAKLFMIKAPLLAATGAVGAALNILLIKAIWPDEDDQEEIFGQMRDRPDKDRIGYRAIGGQIRLPFDYGVLGALDSYGWNTIEEWLLEDKIPSDTKIQTLLARSRDIPSIPDAINPHIKTEIELILNHSFFFEDDIVPQWMVDKYKDEPERQAWPNTPELYKQMGSALKVSPIKIQYAVRNMLDSMMNDFVRTMDPKPFESKSDWPVMGRLMIRPSEGHGSQPVKTIQELDSQWKILRSKVSYLEETDGDTGRLKELQQQISKLTIAHQVMHEVTALWNDVKEEYRTPEPAYDKIKSRKRLMTEKARKFIKWDMAGRTGKFPAGIISDEYRKSLVKQRNMRPSPRRVGEPLADYTKRYQKVMDQKRNAAELLKLL